MCRYLTPTDEIVEKKEMEPETLEKTEAVQSDKDIETRTVESVLESGDSVQNTESVNAIVNDHIVEASENNVETVNSNNETVIKNSEAVPIVENSAVSVELEPSKNESSLGETTVVQSSDTNSKLANEGTMSVDDGETEVPPVENIPTISQFCDPSHYDTNAADIVVNNSVNVSQPETTSSVTSQNKPIEEIKRRVSLPTNHMDNQTADHRNISAAHPASPQKRPRSASTSTQVDTNLFGNI